jgi:hypothetical protein
MKRILLIALVLGFSGSIIGQTLQASIAPGSTPSRIKILVKSNAAIPTTNISTLQFNLGIAEALNPRPTATILANATNFPSVAWQVSSIVEGGFYHYMITTNASPIVVTSLNTTNEVEVLEVEFNGGPLGLNDVSLVSLPGGGTTLNQVFYCTGVPSSDEAALYFTRPGVTVVNNPSYTGPLVSRATVTGIALPVKFLSFYALKNGDNAKLNWTVESDENNKYFDIERSTDGRNFKPHAKVDAKGNGKSINTYETADFNLSKVGSPVIYYRIKQVDKNGEITFSNIRNLNADRNGVPASLFPNPAKNTTRLVIDADGAGKASVVVRDIHGKMVKQLNIQLIKGLNQQDLNVAELASGEYAITVLGEGFSHQLKLTKCVVCNA